MISIGTFYKRYIFFKNTKYEKTAYKSFKKYIFTIMQLLTTKNKNIKHLKKYFFKHIELKYIYYINIKEILFLIFPKTYVKIKQKFN